LVQKKEEEHRIGEGLVALSLGFWFSELRGLLILNKVLLSSPPQFGANKKGGKLQEWEIARFYNE